ncbi:hypothetical protein ACGF5C_28305 [Micromonospora sp. NPDC047620]|uniref:hypothetical protein n=1 Tax=Micromonospora sp. NPDC047620 TaxID=3364251 RepID=UPI00371E30F3
MFVTHGIDEAVHLGRRVAVMTSRPGRIKQVVDIDLGDRDAVADVRFSDAFRHHRHQIWTLPRDEVRAAQAAPGLPPRRLHRPRAGVTGSAAGLRAADGCTYARRGASSRWTGPPRTCCRR